MTKKPIPRRLLKRVKRACGRCRRRRQKCDHEYPCMNCLKSVFSCSLIEQRTVPSISPLFSPSSVPLQKSQTPLVAGFTPINRCEACLRCQKKAFRPWATLACNYHHLCWSCRLDGASYIYPVPRNSPIPPLPPMSYRARRTCEICKRYNVKCDEQRPCWECFHRREECVYDEATAQKRGPMEFAPYSFAATPSAYPNRGSGDPSMSEKRHPDLTITDVSIPMMYKQLEPYQDQTGAWSTTSKDSVQQAYAEESKSSRRRSGMQS